MLFFPGPHAFRPTVPSPTDSVVYASISGCIFFKRILEGGLGSFRAGIGSGIGIGIEHVFDAVPRTCLTANTAPRLSLCRSRGNDGGGDKRSLTDAAFCCAGSWPVLLARHAFFPAGAAGRDDAERHARETEAISLYLVLSSLRRCAAFPATRLF